MLYEIKSLRSGKVIATQESDTLKGALELLVRNGAVLGSADLRGADLNGADLPGAVLRGADLNGADLRGAVLRGADLNGADLRGAVLRGAHLNSADLHGAVLNGADLNSAVLRGAEYLHVPQLHTKILKAIDAGGRLEMGDWHGCETTHCRAGWAIHLAGNVGRFLEAQYGPALAGALITQASCPWLEKVPDFYCGNDAALADIKACAAKEAELEKEIPF